VHNTWNDLPNHIANIALDEFIIMPNHVHGIIRIKDGAGLEPAPTTHNISIKITALPEIVRQFKTFSAKRINIVRQSPGIPVWQRNYYEHIIRDEQSLYRIRKYIRNNPVKWADTANNHIPHEIKKFGMVNTH
jgi:putative transposase